MMPIQAKWAISFLIGGGLVALGWKWLLVLYTLHVLLCLLLILVVLLQSGKAADLAGAFGGAGSQTAFGPRGAANFLTRATTWCAVMFMVTSMTLVLRQSQMQPATGGGSVLSDTAAPQPATPAPAPGTTPPAGAQPAPAGGTQPGTSAPAPATPTPDTPGKAPAQTPPAQPAKNPPAKQ
jgi:preprotein translocase subunit SecG